MIPDNLTYAEFGAFLQAVGEQMFEQDLMFGAAIDGNSDMLIVQDIANRLGENNDLARRRAYEILRLDEDDVVAIISQEVLLKMGEI